MALGYFILINQAWYSWLFEGLMAHGYFTFKDQA
jgi:hypothetical protein